MEHLLPHVDKITTVFLLISISISIRLLLGLLGQRWITTTAHTATLVLLPLITYVITKVISGNIALSLGLVGALSIVRFRNPVRSPLELSVYFGAIAMGIAASIDLFWPIFLSSSVLIASLILVLFHYISKHILKRNFFTASFSEGVPLSTLELTSSEELKLLDDSKYLKMKRLSGETLNYVLVSQNFKDLRDIVSNIKNDKRVISYQINK